MYPHYQAWLEVLAQRNAAISVAIGLIVVAFCWLVVLSFKSPRWFAVARSALIVAWWIGIGLAVVGIWQ